MQKYILFILLFIVFPAVPSAQISICVSIARFDDNFLTLLRSAIADEAQSRGNIDLHFVDAQENKFRQKLQIQTFIENKCQAIIINPVDSAAPLSQLLSQKTRDAGIPLIFVNRQPKITFENNVFYVGSDSYLSGKLQMEYIAKKTNGKGNVVILMGSPLSDPAIERTKAVQDVIAKYPDMHVVDIQVANFSRTEGELVMTRWLQQGKQFDIVASNNDEMALGALTAMKKAGVSPDTILVAGIDATADALESMYRHELAVTVFQNATEQGRAAITAAATLAEKSGQIPSQILIPYELVTPENFKMYLGR